MAGARDSILKTLEAGSRDTGFGVAGSHSNLVASPRPKLRRCDYQNISRHSWPALSQLSQIIIANLDGFGRRSLP
jgi:hypothetical protein